MKILIFNWRDIKHPEAGGAEIHIHEQARRWVEWGHEVTFFTSRPEGSLEQDEIEGIDINRAGGFYTVYPRAALAYLVSLRKKADVLLDLINGIPFFTPIYSMKPAVGLMHHVHSQQFLTEMGPFLGRIGRTIEYFFPALLSYKKIICISKSTADDMRRTLLGVEKRAIEVIHPGIDHGFFSPGNEKFARPTILYLGRIKRYKRLDRLVSMMPEIKKSVGEIELLIAGKGDALSNLKSQVEEKKLTDCVRFLGFVDEEKKLELYRKSWVLAMPSMNEGWGLNVIEANACGTPSVAYRVPGLEESIAHGKSGFLADDDAQFLDFLLRIIRESSLRKQLSEGAIEWASRYDWENTARRTLQVLEEAAYC